MRTYTRHTDLPPDARGASAAIGNFDGVHLGHRAVIDIARQAGQDIGAPLGVVTFDPHPREYFRPETPAFRLMTPDAKAHRLDKIGVELLYALPFDTALSTLTAEAFARDVIATGLGLRHVVVGADFCFGKGRLGTADDLVRFGAALGFGVTIADLQSFQTGDPVSSTRIRAALSEGRPRDAAAMLGHWHRIEGPILHGEKRGRTLGYPTANMALDGLHPPAFGVYAVLADVLNGPLAGSYHGVASLGVRPMFGVNKPNLETFLFDFQGDLYDTPVSVALVDFLRPEMTFDGLDGLITQMDKDSARARDIIAAL